MDFTTNQFRSPKDYNAMKFMKNYLYFSLAVVPMQLCMFDNAYATIKTLSDTELGEQTGQAAFYTNYIDPTATGNYDKLGFFTLGLQGTIALNANIEHLQLGCGGVKGPGCDIDLKQVRLAGTTPGVDGTYASSDATLTNPFIQLAIKNPNSLSTRQLVGFALGAQSAEGQLSIGMNPTPNTPGTVGGSTGGETGINSLSGAFEVATQNLQIPIVVNDAVTGLPIGSGNAYIKATATQPVLPGDLITTAESPATQTGTYYQYFSGSRLTGANFGQFQLAIPNLNIIGVLNLTNTTAYATLAPENLIDLHNFSIAGNKNAGLLLSLNSQAILYPQIGTAGVYSFPTTAQTLNPDGTVATTGYNSNGNGISIAQLQAQPGWFLSAPQANIGGVGSFQKTQTVYLDSLTAVAALAAGVNLPSVNLGQIPITNCYGGLKFC
jgi:hypothetical protein